MSSRPPPRARIWSPRRWSSRRSGTQREPDGRSLTQAGRGCHGIAKPFRRGRRDPRVRFGHMPLYKEQGVILRAIKLGEADKIVTVMTQGSGKVRAVAKGIRKTTSRFGARLEPFTHASLMVYRGRSTLDTISQAEIISPFRALRDDLGLFAAGETMLEAVDKVAEEHERNVRLFLLLLTGLRALQTRPADPAAVAESFLLSLLSLSAFPPSLSACAVCGRRDPDHIGIVMDGNGRWATQRGLPRTEGHAAGEQAMWDTVQGGVEVGLGWLTMFAFSTENWNRPEAEVRYLMEFNRGLLRRRRDELNGMNVRVRFLGRRDRRVPRSVLKEMEVSEELTAANTGMTLTIAFNYGGRMEIADAVKRLIDDHDAGRLDGRKLTPESIASRLYHPDTPDPDLIIRTSGEERISNFLLWQAAYSELYFTPVLWPDFNREYLYEAIRDYQKRSRRFGGLADE